MRRMQVIIGSATRALALAVALLWSNGVGAAPIIVGIEGYVTGRIFDPNNLVESGDQVKAFYIYDSEATEYFSSAPDAGDPFFPTRFSQSFVSAGFPYGIVGSVGSLFFAIQDVYIHIENDRPPLAFSSCDLLGGGQRDVRDAYYVGNNYGYAGQDRFFFHVENCDGTAYDVSHYPMELPPPPMVGTAAGEFLHNYDSFFHISWGATYVEAEFVVTRLYRVPEPSGLALLCLSLAGLAFTRRRKR